jgi:sterol desaturase/sphingolipid hydroxylase (fatty acid hydroxylase superfamily)
MSLHFIHMVRALGVEMFRLSLWLVLLTVVFAPLERLFSLQPHTLRRGDVARDVVFYVLNSILPAIVIAAPLGVWIALLNRVTPAAYTQAVASLPFGVKLAAGVVIAEFGAYWGHRWSHETPFLWRFHAIHHAPTHIDWLVNTRAHPVDVVFTRLCGLGLLYLLGFAHPGAHGQGAMIPIYVTLIGTVWAFFIHANVRWRFGALEQVVATPAFHHWHHTNDEHRDHNYAALLPVMDRLFGTLHLPAHWPPCYGVDAPPPPTLVGQLLGPFGESSVVIRRQ